MISQKAFRMENKEYNSIRQEKDVALILQIVFVILNLGSWWSVIIKNNQHKRFERKISVKAWIWFLHKTVVLKVYFMCAVEAPFIILLLR